MVHTVGMNERKGALENEKRQRGRGLEGGGKVAAMASFFFSVIGIGLLTIRERGKSDYLI